MIKKVAILNNEIVHVYHDESEELLIEEATIGQREMKYSEEYGWREVGWTPSMTQEDKIIKLEQEKEDLALTLDMILTELIPNLTGGN